MPAMRVACLLPAGPKGPPKKLEVQWQLCGCLARFEKVQLYSSFSFGLFGERLMRNAFVR